MTYRGYHALTIGIFVHDEALARLVSHCFCPCQPPTWTWSWAPPLTSSGRWSEWLALPGNLLMRTLSCLSMPPLVLLKLKTAIGSTGRHLQPGTRQHIYGKFCSKVLKNIRSLSKVVIVVQPSAALAQLAKFLLTVILGDLKKKLRTPQVRSRNYCQ